MRKSLSSHPFILVVAVLAAIAFGIAGCSGESPTATAIPTETPEPEAPQAPDFSLPTGTGERHTLDDLLAGRDALVLVFYRSYG